MSQHVPCRNRSLKRCKSIKLAYLAISLSCTLQGADEVDRFSRASSLRLPAPSDAPGDGASSAAEAGGGDRPSGGRGSGTAERTTPLRRLQVHPPSLLCMLAACNLQCVAWSSGSNEYLVRLPFECCIALQLALHCGARMSIQLSDEDFTLHIQSKVALTTGHTSLPLHAFT
jgi:hypothetical protein